jgi:hypothetical protein
MTTASEPERDEPSTEGRVDRTSESPNLSATSRDEQGAELEAPAVASGSSNGLEDEDEQDEQTGRTTVLPPVGTNADASAEGEPDVAAAQDLADDAESGDDSDLMLEDDASEAPAVAAPEAAAAPSEVLDADALPPEPAAPAPTSPLLEELAAEVATSPASDVEAAAPGEPSALDPEPSGDVPEGESPERVTLPDSIAAKRRDEPLPSFDIPELETAPPAPVAAALQAAAPALAAPWVARTGSEPPPRPRAPSPVDNVAVAPAPVVPAAERLELPPLDELDEDEEDAVTSIELSIADVSDVPSAPSSFEVAAAGFAPEPPVAAPAVAFAPPPVAFAPPPMPELNPRRAATVLIRRVEGVAPPGIAAAKRASSKLLEGVSGLFARRRLPRFEGGPGTFSLRRAGRFLDSILPELSLVLFGSGLGAGSVLLVMRHSDEASEQVQAQALQPLRAEPESLGDRLRAGDREALASVAHLPASERSSALLLAKEEGEGVQSRQDFRAFVTAFKAPGADPSGKQLGRFVEFATNSSTMVDALTELTELPGPEGPDLIYSVWENAPGGNRAASLARSLLHTPDQRSKASPALRAALDLSDGKSCEDYARALPEVLAQGDERSLALMVALTHTDGCGDDREQDCYPCLRTTSTLNDAIEAVRQRPAPKL